MISIDTCQSTRHIGVVTQVLSPDHQAPSIGATISQNQFRGVLGFSFNIHYDIEHFDSLRRLIAGWLHVHLNWQFVIFSLQNVSNDYCLRPITHVYKLR